VYKQVPVYRLKTGVQVPAGAMVGIFLFRHRVQTFSGAHPASFPRGTEIFYPEDKMTEA